MLAVTDWSESLTERVVAALDAGDSERARGLVLGGDGRAKNLASEFRLMHKGLGITMRVALHVMEEQHPFDAVTTCRLLSEFHAIYLALAERYLSPPKSTLPVREFDPAEINRYDVVELLEWVETEFVRDQASRAAAIADSIDAGEDVVGALMQKRDEGFRPLHDALIEGLASIFSSVVDGAGTDVEGAESLRRFQLAVAEGQREGIDKWEEGGSRKLAAAFTHLLVQHLSDFDVEEQSDRFLISQRLCGSGGVLIRKGRYEGANALRTIAGRSEVTGGHDSLPAYCTHCPMWNTVAPSAWYGHEHVRFIHPARPDGACTLAVMKYDEHDRGEN